MDAETRLWADVYNAQWERLGDGPVPLSSASVTRAFDGAGSFSFEAPATDERVIDLLKNERRVKIIYHDPQTDTVRTLGSGIIQKRGRKYGASGSLKTFNGTDLMSELKRANTLLNRVFTNTPVADVASALAVLAGWSAETESTLDNLVSARFDGASILKALQTMVEQLGVHLREKVDIPSDRDRVIEVGHFATDSGIWIQNGELFTSAIYDNTEVAFIDSLTVTHESEELVNWAIPLGSGEGESALTLEKATRTPTYPRETTVVNGKTQWYKRHTASENQYGTCQKVVTFKNISPVSNSDTAIEYAANMLDEAMDAALDRISQEQIVYQLSVKKLSRTVRPGDVVHLRFNGLIRDQQGQEIAEENVEGDFYVLKVTENVSASGVTVTLDISNVDKNPESEEAYILSAVEDIKLSNVKPALINFRESTSGERPLQNSIAVSDVLHAIFLLPIDDTVTDITSVFLRFWSIPLYCNSVTEIAFSKYSQFVIVQSPNYPQGISLRINGIDVTSQYGPDGSVWNPVPNNNPVNGEFLDITDHIKNATGGIRQVHEIEFRVVTNARDTAVPGYGFTRVDGSGNNGIIRATITVQGTSQAIKVIS